MLWVHNDNLWQGWTGTTTVFQTPDEDVTAIVTTCLEPGKCSCTGLRATRALMHITKMLAFVSLKVITAVLSQWLWRPDSSTTVCQPGNTHTSSTFTVMKAVILGVLHSQQEFIYGIMWLLPTPQCADRVSERLVATLWGDEYSISQKKTMAGLIGFKTKDGEWEGNTQRANGMEWVWLVSVTRTKTKTTKTQRRMLSSKL